MLRFMFATLVVLFNVSTALADDVPLPSDAAVTPPEANVTADAARFSGRWGGGKWDGNLDSRCLSWRLRKHSSGSLRVLIRMPRFIAAIVAGA